MYWFPILERSFFLRRSAKNRQGEWEEFPLSCEPIFVASVLIAQNMFHSGPRSEFQNISIRSSILAVANQALNAGVNIDRGTLSGPALIGIPAEVYRKRRSIWSRIFS